MVQIRRQDRQDEKDKEDKIIRGFEKLILQDKSGNRSSGMIWAELHAFGRYP
jgi:hypothetical protein